MVVARIDRDYIEKDLTTPTRVGLEWDSDKDIPEYIRGSLSTADKVRFRMKDDDGEVYYGGWLLDDDEGEVQSWVLAWGMRDAGCTTIEVKKNGEWVQEIG